MIPRRQLHFVMNERPLCGFAEQVCRGVSLLDAGSGGVALTTTGELQKTEGLQEALMMSLANLDLTLMHKSLCGIIPTHMIDYMSNESCRSLVCTL